MAFYNTDFIDSSKPFQISLQALGHYFLALRIFSSSIVLKGKYRQLIRILVMHNFEWLVVVFIKNSVCKVLQSHNSSNLSGRCD